jgi:hypothetical protein
MVLNGTMWQKDGLFLAEPPMIEEEPNLIWLPNSLVTGTHRKEASPIKRLRSRGECGHSACLLTSIMLKI